MSFYCLQPHSKASYLWCENRLWESSILQRSEKIYLTYSECTFWKQFSEFLRCWKLLLWTIGKYHFNHVGSNNTTLGSQTKSKYNEILTLIQRKTKTNCGHIIKLITFIYKKYTKGGQSLHVGKHKMINNVMKPYSSSLKSSQQWESSNLNKY